MAMPVLMLVVSAGHPGTWLCAGATAATMLVPLLMFLMSPRFMLDRRGNDAARGAAERRELQRIPQITLMDPTADARVEAGSWTGTAHGEDPLRSPLTRTPCLGWRIVGSGPAGAIDEAELADFELRSGDELLRVEGGRGSIALAPAGPLVVATASMTAYLDARFAHAAHGPIRVREAVLRSGDAVVVTAHASEELAPDGYRGQRTRRVLRDTEGAPLVVSSR